MRCFYDGHDQQPDCFDNNSDLDDVRIDDDFTEEVEMQSTKSKGHYHLTYPHLDRGLVISRKGDLSQSKGCRKENWDAYSVAIKLSPFFMEHLSGSQTMTVSVSFLNGAVVQYYKCTFEGHKHFLHLAPKVK